MANDIGLGSPVAGLGNIPNIGLQLPTSTIFDTKPLGTLDRIYVVIDGYKYDRIESCIITLPSMVATCGEFNIHLCQYTKGTDIGTILGLYPTVEVQDKVEIYFEKDLVLTGYVEELDCEASNGTRNIIITGRTSGFPILKSHVIPRSYRDLYYPRLVKSILNDNGYSNIKVINEITDDLLLLPRKSPVEAQNTDTVFNALDRYAQKVQVLIRFNEFGNLLIFREAIFPSPGYLVQNFSGVGNNIKYSKSKISIKDRFHFVEVYCQTNYEDDPERSQITQFAVAIDDDILDSSRRRIHLRGATAPKQTVQDIANWYVNLYRAKSLQYDCIVAGFRIGIDTGPLWKVNTIISIKDEIENIFGLFLLQSVKYERNTSGSISHLSFANLGSFVRNPLGASLSKQKKIGQGFFRKA